MSTPKYVLITPARNEGDFIENVIQSVVSQTVLPQKWIIVSDGSTDRTDEIVAGYLAPHPWMELIRIPEHRERNFASKVHCFNAGHERAKRLPYDIVGNLDADITFDPDYFEFLLSKFAADPKLGVAGTPFIERNSHYDYRFASLDHVSGACQLFKRECFEDIGGYTPIEAGGIDWTAVTTARMKGWTTKTYPEKSCAHHRKIGTRDSGRLKAIFQYGRKNYMLGGHPLWQVSRAIYQMTRKPYGIGGVLLMAGYAWGFIARTKRPIGPDLLLFYRREQMTRLKAIISNMLSKQTTGR